MKKKFLKSESLIEIPLLEFKKHHCKCRVKCENQPDSGGKRGEEFIEE